MSRKGYTDPNQERSVREELHAIVDYAVDHWSEMQQMAKSAGRGYAMSSYGGGGGGGAEATVVELAAGKEPDPGEMAHEWLALMQELIGIARSVERKARAVLPLTEKEQRRAADRKPTVEKCTECNQPAVEGVKRIDGKPYCKNSCYFRVWRARRAG